MSFAKTDCEPYQPGDCALAVHSTWCRWDYLMAEGRIVASGSDEDLMAHSELYCELAANQLDWWFGKLFFYFEIWLAIIVSLRWRSACCMSSVASFCSYFSRLQLARHKHIDAFSVNCAKPSLICLLLEDQPTNESVSYLCRGAVYPLLPDASAKATPFARLNAHERFVLISALCDGFFGGQK